MSITKYLNLSHLRKLLSALGQRFYAIEQRQDNLQSQIENIDLDVETDTTLSVSGMPADAQAVGSKFGNLSDTAYSGNISSLDNITNLDQYVLYSSMGYFSFNGQAINNLFIPTNASVNGFPLFVPYGTYSYDTSIYYRIYWKNSPSSAIATYRGIYVDGSFVGVVVSGVYLAKVTDSKLYLYTLLTMDNASSTVPSMDGTASVGSSIKYARADHVHPRDTTKADASQVLTLTNTTAYTPTATYHPATKGYVDGLIPTKTSDLVNDSDFMSGMTILSYGHSTWNDFITAYESNHVVYCRASSNSNPAIGGQTRMAFMAYVNNGITPTWVEFQYYRSVKSHSDTQQGDQVYIYTLDKTAGWTVTVRNTYTRIVAGTGIDASYSNGVLTISLANDFGFQTQAQVNALIAAAGDDDTEVAT